MKRIVIFIILSVAVASLTGCRSTQYVDRVVNNTIHQTDTLHQYDSVYVNRFIQVFRHGDTIFQNSIETKYKYKYIYQTRHDTIQRDSIIIRTRVKKEVKEVAKPLSWWQRTQMIIGDSFLLLFLVMLIFGIVKSFKLKNIQL